jgi:hypothetical protein
MSVTLTLNEQNLQALVGLLDAGVKATGLGGVKAGAVILAEIEAAVEAAKKAQSDNVITLPEKEAV